MEELQNSLNNLKITFIDVKSDKNYNEQWALLKNYLDIFKEGIVPHLSNCMLLFIISYKLDGKGLRIKFFGKSASCLG